MKDIVRAIRKTVYGSSLIGLFVFLSGFGGCDGGGGNPPPPPNDDGVWCDIMAIQCAYFFIDPNTGVPTGCAIAMTETTRASAPGSGDLVCFDSDVVTPQQACAGTCFPANPHLNDIRWPEFNNLRSLCTATVNTDPQFHPAVNAEGFEPNLCGGSSASGLSLASQGTNAVMLTGGGTATLDGGSAQNVAIIGGFFNMAAPDTECAPGDNTCPTQLNQAEVDFDDFPFAGHSVTDLRLFLDSRVLTSSGVVAGGNFFVFSIPQNVFFQAQARVDGSLTGLVVRSTQEVFGTINLATGEIVMQFDVAGPFNGQTLEISGTALTSTVTHRAPVVSAPLTQDVAGTNSDCTGDVTLTATATSAAGLPVELNYSSEDENFGSGPSVVATLPVGTTEIQILGIDSNGMQDTAFQTVTVTDAAGPVISAPPDATITTCVNASIGTATATDGCGGGPITVTNNAPTRFPPGVTIVTYTATDSLGNQSTAQQRVTAVLTDDPSCCPVGTNVIMGTLSNDNLPGTGGSDCIIGRGAQDTINGNGGNDFISGGEGNDTINGGPGNDVIFGGSGQDPLVGGTGNDQMFGEGGDDNLQGGIGDDTLSGGTGQDTMLGQDGNDRLDGNDGHDNLQGGIGNDNMVGAGGNDTCTDTTGTNTFAGCDFGAPNSCADGVQNGTETGLNCGGGCPDCATGEGCFSSNDCTSNICSSGFCEEIGGGGAGTVSTSLTYSTDWGGGYCAVLNITNNSTNPTAGYTVNLDTNGSTIYDSWEGTFVGSSGPVSVTPCCEYNRIIDPSETEMSIGFCANRTVPGSGLLPFVVNTTATF